ncbi:MAG TPA: ABC transporter permease, partial [Opitutaceae bacterium]|nr:ABC transporter permease [Opitutaceae bacterium]
MKALRPMLVRFAGLFRRKQREAEMNEEMHAHLEGLIQRNRGKGMSPDDARFAALRTFGGVAQIQERARDERMFIWLEQARQDFSHACRALARNRGFAIVAALTLALGLGVNCALFTLFNAVALRPLPLKDPDQIVDVECIHEVGYTFVFSYADYRDFRAAQQGFEGLAAWTDQTMALDPAARRATSFAVRTPAGAASSNVPVQLVSENYFAVLGAEMVLGRAFRPDENIHPGAHPVIVLQHRFWVEQFDADTEIVGKTLKLGQTAYTVIGVTAPEFVGKTPAPPAGWIPAMMLDAKDGNGAKALADRDNGRFRVTGRLRPGVTRESARVELEGLVRQLRQQYPRKDAMIRVTLVGGTTFIPTSLDRQMVLGTMPLWLSFLFVLVIACANVANLLLARACTRQQEIGVRLAMGATRGRIVRHLMAESVIIATAGGAAGLFVTTWLLHAIRPRLIALVPPNGTAREWLFLNLHPDYRVFAFTLGLAFFAALVAGLFPALLAARADVNASLRNSSVAFTRPSRLRHALVVAQVALCFTLLAASALLVRHVVRFTQIDTGLQTENVFTGSISVLPGDFSQRDAAAQTEAIAESVSPAARLRAIELARGLPGVRTIAQAYREPYTGRMRLTPVVPDAAADGSSPQLAKFNLVSAEYFAALGIAARRGRLFTAHEVASNVPLVVISESTARRFWPDGNALGRTLRVAAVAFTGGWSDPRQARRDPPGAYSAFEVVGVVPDARSGWIAEVDETMLYLPLRPESPQARATLIQFAGPREAMLPLFWGAVEARGLGLGMSVRQSLDEWRNLQLLPYKAAAIVAA